MTAPGGTFRARDGYLFTYTKEGEYCRLFLALDRIEQISVTVARSRTPLYSMDRRIPPIYVAGKTGIAGSITSVAVLPWNEYNTLSGILIEHNNGFAAILRNLYRIGAQTDLETGHVRTSDTFVADSWEPWKAAPTVEYHIEGNELIMERKN
jgi:hypothetical protein